MDDHDRMNKVNWIKSIWDFFAKNIFRTGPWIFPIIIVLIVWLVIKSIALPIWFKVVLLVAAFIFSLATAFYVPKGKKYHHNIGLMLVSEQFSDNIVDVRLKEEINDLIFVYNQKFNGNELHIICPNPFSRYTFNKIINCGNGSALNTQSGQAVFNWFQRLYLKYLAEYVGLEVIVYGKIILVKNDGVNFYSVFHRMEGIADSDLTLHICQHFANTSLEFQEDSQLSGLKKLADAIHIFCCLYLLSTYSPMCSEPDENISLFTEVLKEINSMESNLRVWLIEECADLVKEVYNHLISSLTEDITCAADSEKRIFEMMQLYNQYLKMFPKDVSIFNNRAYYLMEHLGRQDITYREYKTEVEKILKEYEDFLNSGTTDYSFCASMAYLCLIVGRHADAEKYFGILYCDDKDARVARADAYAYYQKNLHNEHEGLYANYALALYRYKTNSDLERAKEQFSELSKNKTDLYVAGKSREYFCKIQLKKGRKAQ